MNTSPSLKIMEILPFSHLHRSRALDVLRGVAVILVLFRHKYLHYELPGVLEAVSFFGWTGVDLFFVLSGLLIGGQVFREYREYGSIHVGRFLVRRGLRIYPPFFALIAAEVFLLWYGQIPFTGKQILLEMTFLQNYFRGLGLTHTWSLAVEEHFYLLFAAGSFLLPALEKPKAAIGFFAGGLFFFLLMRVLTTIGLPYSLATHLYATHLRLDSLLFGVFLAYLINFRKPVIDRWLERPRRIGAIGVAMVAPAWFLPQEHAFMHSFGLTFLYLGFGSIIVAALGAKKDSLLFCSPPAKAIALVGRYSYSIYLWHLFFLLRVLQYFRGKFALEMSEDTLFVAYFFGSLLFGIFMGRLIEIPVLRWRDKIIPRSAGDRPLSSVEIGRISGASF